MGLASPRGAEDASIVGSLHVAPARREPMVPVEEIVVEAGAGVVGDRYFGTRHRHVSVQSLDALAAASAALGRPVAPAATRRTVTVTTGPVPTEPGTRIRVGTVELEVVRVAAPCRVLEENLGPGGRKAMHGRGGTVFRALTSGVIRLGDPVTVQR